jgi:dTDP-4-dehydrorhamnose reductase
VVNAAGKTRSSAIPTIDGCVESFAAQSDTFHSNTVGAGHVATACREAGVKLIHLASGCIYDGDAHAFTETDPPNPVSWYARTKAMGDQLVQAYCPDALILRIRMPMSAQPHSRNLVTKLASAKAVIDVTNSVTVVEDLLPWSFNLLAHGVTGVVHAVHPAPVAFRALMAQYTAIVNPAQVTTFIPKTHYRTADGRSNCVLRTRALPVVLPPTDVAITRALQAYALTVRGVPVHDHSRFWTDWMVKA